MNLTRVGLLLVLLVLIRATYLYYSLPPEPKGPADPERLSAEEAQYSVLMMLAPLREGTFADGEYAPPDVRDAARTAYRDIARARRKQDGGDVWFGRLTCELPARRFSFRYGSILFTGTYEVRDQKWVAVPEIIHLCRR